jgi:methyltransferase (TIGR00027 family)
MPMPRQRGDSFQAFTSAVHDPEKRSTTFERELPIENDRPSRTSEAAAVHRAVHQLLDDEPKILPDPIALRIVEMPKETDLKVEASKPGFRQVRSRLVMRSRYAEDCLAEAVAQRAITQYLILGAGLDTFGFRQPSWSQAIQIFEADHPATQRYKRERVETADLFVPPTSISCRSILSPCR